MAAATATKPEKPGTKPTKGDPLPQEPPEEQFWEKYSPHYELPIGTFASGAIHLVIVLIFIALFKLAMAPDEKTRVPVRGMILADADGGGQMGTAGSGPEDRKEATNEERQDPPRREIPQEELQKNIASVAQLNPDLSPNALEKLAQSPNIDKLKDLNDELKERLKNGFKPGKGGTGSGDGPKGPGSSKEGTGGSGNSNANTPGEQSLRWTIVFKTASGEDYLRQLSAFKAKLLIPESPDWKTNRYFEKLTSPNEGMPSKGQETPPMAFTDSDKVSASKVARALGLDYDPPYFVAFFPDDVREDMANKERKFRGLQPEQIYSTTFRVIEQNGKLEIRVTDQIKAKK
jgi:hypothetical protein